MVKLEGESLVGDGILDRVADERALRDVALQFAEEFSGSFDSDELGDRQVRGVPFSKLGHVGEEGGAMKRGA
jgi:hypothetical protein